jgi:hypothetical protein
MNTIIAWLVSFMLTLPYQPSKHETKDQRDVRITAIATDMVEVAFDPKEASVISGPNGRAATAFLGIAIASFEGEGFRVDIDLDLNRKERLSKGEEDGGRSHCLMQIMTHKGHSAPWNVAKKRPWRRSDTEAPESFTVEQLRDRKNCFRAGLRALRSSWGSCGGKEEDALRLYASGSCTKGGEISRKRVAAFRSWYYARPVPSMPRPMLLAELVAPAPLAPGCHHSRRWHRVGLTLGGVCGIRSAPPAVVMFPSP